MPVGSQQVAGVYGPIGPRLRAARQLRGVVPVGAQVLPWPQCESHHEHAEVQDEHEEASVKPAKSGGKNQEEQLVL